MQLTILCSYIYYVASSNRKLQNSLIIQLTVDSINWLIMIKLVTLAIYEGIHSMCVVILKLYVCCTVVCFFVTVCMQLAVWF